VSRLLRVGLNDVSVVREGGAASVGSAIRNGVFGMFQVETGVFGGRGYPPLGRAMEVDTVDVCRHRI
jgi:hypothetical protein